MLFTISYVNIYYLCVFVCAFINVAMEQECDVAHSRAQCSQQTNNNNKKPAENEGEYGDNANK